jgi:hypothetical protein
VRVCKAEEVGEVKNGNMRAKKEHKQSNLTV